MRYRLPVAKNEDPFAFDQTEEVGELFAVPFEATVVSERRPSSSNPTVLGVPRVDEVRDGLQPIYP